MPHPHLIFSQSDYLIQIVDINSHIQWQAVQIQISWLLQKPTDLDLHCLQKRTYPGSAGQGLIYSHFVQTITILHRHIYLVNQLQHLLHNSRILQFCTILESGDKVNVLTLCKTIPELYRFLLCAEHIHVFKFLLWNCFSNFHQISHGAFCQKGIDNLFDWFHTIEQDGCHARIL